VAAAAAAGVSLSVLEGWGYGQRSLPDPHPIACLALPGFMSYVESLSPSRSGKILCTTLPCSLSNIPPAPLSLPPAPLCVTKAGWLGPGRSFNCAQQKQQQHTQASTGGGGQQQEKQQHKDTGICSFGVNDGNTPK